MSTSSPSSGLPCMSNRALAIAAMLGCASCAGALEDADRFAPPPPDASVGDAPDSGPGDTDLPDGGSGPEDGGCNTLTKIIAPTCATALCHSSGTQQGSLDLQSKGLPGRLVGKAAVGGPGLLIDPAHPDSSVLYTKTIAPAPYGARMPLLGTGLSADQRACLREWIEQAVAPQ
jgi:hypothetical protein